MHKDNAMKILVIDDEKPTLSMFNLFLSAYGYDVCVAESGEEGLEIFKSQAPDIVFTDIKMPGIDGLEVLRRIRRLDQDTQVVIITGHGDVEKAVEALELNASDFINKPVERQALNSALARAEKRRAMPSDLSFVFDLVCRENRLEISVKGRLTQKETGTVLDRIKAEGQKTFDSIHFITDDSFSISKGGISALMKLVRELSAFSDHIFIENLSYNYVRVFQMAGIGKLAELVEEILPE